MYDILFEKQKIGKMIVPNRLVMTAMGNHYADHEGYVTDTDINFYATRAKGGVGLIIPECMPVDPKTGVGNNAQLFVHDDKFIPGLKKLAAAVHEHNAVIAGQIYHPGRQTSGEPLGLATVKSASAIPCGLVQYPTHAMTKAEIDEMVGYFAAAARRLKEADFDAVEIHGAHGYLINQFLSPYSNVRTDEYGGSQENRMRFVKEIIEAVRRECGPDFRSLSVILLMSIWIM